MLYFLYMYNYNQYNYDYTNNENTKDIYLIECKYSDNVNPKEILEDLKEKSEYLNLDI